MIKLKSLLIEKLKDTDSIWDPNGPMNRDIILTALKKDRKIMKHVGKADEDIVKKVVDDPYLLLEMIGNGFLIPN